MGFKSLFKVRKPGNGGAFEKRVKSAIASAKAKVFPSSDNTANSYGKKGVIKWFGLLKEYKQLKR